MQKFSALFVNTLLKEFRSKTLMFLLFLTIIVLLLVNSTMNFYLQLNSQNISLSDSKLAVYFLIIIFWGIFLGAMLGSNCIKSDENDKMFDQFLSFPITRLEYLIARITGTWFIVICYYLFSIFAGIVILSNATGVEGMYSKVCVAFFYNCLILLGVISFAALYSLFTPKLIAFCMTILTYLFISLANGFVGPMSIEVVFQSPSITNMAGKLIDYILPRLGTLKTISNSIIMDRQIEQNTGIEILHYVLTYSILFLLIWFIFNKKEI